MLKNKNSEKMKSSIIHVWIIFESIVKNIITCLNYTDNCKNYCYHFYVSIRYSYFKY